MNTDVTMTGTQAVNTDIVYWKPLGRGRHFDRLRRGLARRMRIPFVRQTLWDRNNPEAARCPASSYGQPWLSTNALANFSFACTCHPNERYKRQRHTGNES